MSLQLIDIPAEINRRPITPSARHLIDVANLRIETYSRNPPKAIENFVHCDFHLVEQSLDWIVENHLLAGDRFCELGSGFGVATMLAALRGMDSIGIEIEPVLVKEARELAAQLDLNCDFYCGSFVPRGIFGLLELACEVEHVATEEGDVCDELRFGLDSVDLFFAFPWPGEHAFFETVFESEAASGSLLLSYRGRDGMHLLRKV